MTNLLAHHDFQDASFLAIRDLSMDDAKDCCGKSPHRKANFEILWIEEGSGVHRIEKMNYPISGNMVFCGSPGQLNPLQADERMKGYLISFSESFLRHGNDDSSGVYGSDFFDMFSRFSAIPLEKEIAIEMADIVRKMVKASAGHLLGTELVRRYLKIFLLYLFQQFDQGKSASLKPASNTLVKRFVAVVEKDFRFTKSVAAYADQLAVTANHLNEAVKKVLGHSAGYHIRQRIIQEAKRRAAFSDSNMKEIAYDLGFDTASHFSKYFKNYAGMNFSYFKKVGSTASLAM